MRALLALGALVAGTFALMFHELHEYQAGVSSPSPCVASYSNEHGTWCYLTPDAAARETGR